MAGVCGQAVQEARGRGEPCSHAEEGRWLRRPREQAWPWLRHATAGGCPDCSSAAGTGGLRRSMAASSRASVIIRKMVILARVAGEGKPAALLGLLHVHTYAERKTSLS